MAVSTSLGFEEVVRTAVGMMWGSPVDGGVCFAGREKPDGAGSKE